MEYQKIAKKQIEIIKKDFFQDNKLMYKPNVTVASLWDYSAYFTAIVKLYKTNPEEYESILDETLKNLEWYLAKNRTDGYLVYASENGNEKPVFYDDNVWLVIGFLELYEIKSEKKYLEKALRILDFIYDSWQTNLGGGLLWREFPDDLEKSNWVRNTCINAPTAYASLRVYELTNNPVYLEWGEKIYKWTKDNLEDSNTHLYFDNINHFGKVDKTYWTYNVGVMISAASLLFKITKDQKYETDSINSINSANNKLSAKHEDKEKSFNYYDDHPWFRVYLFQGMLDAYVCLSINNKKKIEKYFDDVISGFEYMYEKYQDTNKLILNDWSKLHNKEDEVLFASGNLESICIFDEYQKINKKVKMRFENEKNLLMIIVALFGFMLVSCKKDEPVKIENKYYDEASQLLDKYYNDFWIKGANRFKAYHPEDLSTGSEYRGTAALWGYGAAMTAVTSGLQVNPKDKDLIAKADELVKELEQYRYRSLSYRYYSAIVGGTGEPYYDDNAWVVISLYEMAQALGNEEYMTISREILDYVLSGEAEEGGLYWKESVISRNVAAIGPAIIGSLMHYQNKKEDVLLETAIRLYDWTVRVLRDPVDKVYWDNAIQREDGTEQIEYTKWTYNSGTMISAGLMLYEITKEEKYLTDARLTAEGSFNRFRTIDNTRDIAYFPATPWFNVYLARAYREMAIIDNNDKYINAFKEFADLAISRGKDKNGYIYPSWGSGSILSEYQYVSGLNQAGTIEILFVIANYELNKE